MVGVADVGQPVGDQHADAPLLVRLARVGLRTGVLVGGGKGTQGGEHGVFGEGVQSGGAHGQRGGAGQGERERSGVDECSELQIGQPGTDAGHGAPE